jgi:hypothetical protein
VQIPVISLWQPWASLIFERIKKHETRGPNTPLPHVGVPVGIAATAKFPPLKLISEELHEICMDVWGCGYNFTLPQGCILGTVVFDRRIQTVDWEGDREDEICGDWRPGRFAWPIRDVVKFGSPIPAKGKQGWWKHNLEVAA